MSQERFEVQHRPDESRYVLVDRGADGAPDVEIGVAQYVDLPDAHERVLFHTVVSPDYSGQGLASLLVRTVVADLVAAGLAVVPVCSYVAAWLPKHPEYADHVVKPTAAHLAAVRAAGE